MRDAPSSPAERPRHYPLAMVIAMEFGALLLAAGLAIGGLAYSRTGGMITPAKQA